MTASKSGKCTGCQTEQLIFDKTDNVMLYENKGTEKSLTYFCPEQIKGSAKIRKSFSLDGLSFLFY